MYVFCHFQMQKLEKKIEKKNPLFVAFLFSFIPSFVSMTYASLEWDCLYLFVIQLFNRCVLLNQSQFTPDFFFLSDSFNQSFPTSVCVIPDLFLFRYNLNKNQERYSEKSFKKQRSERNAWDFVSSQKVKAKRFPL